MPHKTPAKLMLMLVYLASLLYSLGYALPLYVNSTFLAEVVPTDELISLVFAGGALLSIFSILALPRILNRFGNYRTTSTVILLEIVALILLAVATNPVLIVLTFMLNQVLLNVAYLNLNTLLESFSQETSTGSIRGIFLTIVNAAILIAPFLGGLLLTNGDFEKIYLASAGFLATVLAVFYTNFRDYVDPKYQTPTLKETYHVVRRSHDLHAIIFVQFLLNFFYAWMVIYTPLYLHEHMGIPMNEILGVIIPIALLPFVLFQVILGKIADATFGEKEILVLSFLILISSTALLTYIESPSVILWALALFVTRVGASAIEVMSESYFYKQVSPSDAHLITFAYVARSSAYLIGPILGSLFLTFFDDRFIFLALAGIMALGIPYSLHFKDSK